MNDRGVTHSIDYSGDFVEYRIPASTSAERLEFNLKGADGGKHNGCSRKAGEGATVRAVFAIGTGTNELRPGGYIRVIVGGKGESYANRNDGGAGGGGGTGILYSTNNTSTDATPNFSDQNTKWVILAVAGGGGGVSVDRDNGLAGACTNGDDGSGGNTGTSGTSGRGNNSGGSDGNGGVRLDSEDAGAGGGYLTNGANNNSAANGRRGWVTGGAGGASSGDFTREGGFGYGGGGTGRNIVKSGGGGGGGYSGGGGGNTSNTGRGGGGGGSFINGASIGQFDNIDGSTTTNSSEDGWANFTFRSAGNPEIACRTGATISINGDNYGVFVNNVVKYYRIEVGQTITSLGFVVNGQTMSTIFLDCSDVGTNRLINQVMIVSSSSGALDFCQTNLQIRDNVAPELTCISSPVVGVGPSSTYTVPISQVRNTLVDDCGSIVSQVLSPVTVDCDDVGVPTTFTLTVTDNSGNTDACTVVATPFDAANPVARCQDVVIELTGSPADLDPLLVDNGSTDNCGIASYVLSQSTFTAADIGDNPVTLTVRDAYGNLHRCNAVITVQDEILPVSWRYFTAGRSTGKSVLLNWGTAQETNNAGFTIQRSIDGEDWGNIGFKAASEAVAPSYYFEDEQPPASTLYYRLRQEDHDGSFAFSAIRQVQQIVQAESVYPNPFAEVVTFVSDVAQEVTIYDLKGQVVATVFHVGNGAQKEVLDLKAGLYQVYFQRSGKVLRVVSVQ